MSKMVSKLPSRVTRVFGEPFLAYMWALVAMVGSAFYLHARQPAGSALLALVAVTLALITSQSTTVIVGADGIVVRWLGLTRFFAHASIVTIEPHVAYVRTQMGTTQRKSSGLLVRCVDGSSTYLVCNDATARDLRAAIEQRLDAHRQTRPAEMPQLRRGARSVTEWTRDLRALLRERGYRERAPETHTLWNLVENPKNTAEERAAAALALRTHLGEEARPRLRVATDACASPKLRLALEAIADDDEAKTIDELGRLEAQNER